MLFSKSIRVLSAGLAVFSDAIQARALGSDGTELIGARDQDIVTWDDHSLSINGERVMIFSGEFHAFRLPVVDLWLDVFQKIKAAGYNCISIYINYALLEGKRGTFRSEGIFSLEPLFESAKQAGLYVIARPGPYINAEVSGGGFPGWMTKVQGALRTNSEEYMNATDLYTKQIGEIISKAQITNGGPVILFQPENEYQHSISPYPMPEFPYWEAVQEQYRRSDIVVPYINNEAFMAGYISTDTESSVDIYGHDGYPLGFDCDNPSEWPEDGLPTDWLVKNNAIAPDSPYTIPEFQGGGFQHWGQQAGFDKCAELLNHEFERVLYKNNYGFGATIFNIYMIFGGTNWGNLGHAQGYTSYDYGAQITEQRLIWREKYSEVKLQANFFHVSPAFLEADRFEPSLEYTDTDAITVTPAKTDTTKFYISRHTKYSTTESVEYRLKVSTVNYGDIEIPQNGGRLVMNRRDSKIHVSDYPVGDKHVIYSSAEIFTWKKYDDKTILVLYGGPNEHHEMAFEDDRGGDDEGVEVDGDEVNVDRSDDGYTIISWDISDDVEDRKVVKVGDFHIYLLNRNEAYNFWVPPTGNDYGTSDIILKAGYLIRTAQRHGKIIDLVGDVNATTPIEIIGGAPSELEELTFNGSPLKFEQTEDGVVTASVKFCEPKVEVPELTTLDWKKIDSLPELSAEYDDSAWIDCDLEESFNDKNPSTTYVSLYVDDYGFHTGSVLLRGYFTANGEESTLEITTAGGFGSGSSIWIGDTFLGSVLGIGDQVNGTLTLDLPSDLESGEEYILTVLIDYTGLNGNYVIGEDTLKEPRGILDYEFAGHSQEDIKWKVTGNLGGEDYRDLVRGPLNEGGLFIERQGYHQPSPPSEEWEEGNPTEAISKPGVTFYTTTVDLDLPKGYDIPLSIKFDIAAIPKATRVQIWVNGYQFGKLTSNIGPQEVYPVPQGILNYQGTNTIGVSVWALEEGGTQLKGFEWEVGMISKTGFGEIGLSPAPKWEKRDDAH